MLPQRGLEVEVAHEGRVTTLQLAQLVVVRQEQRERPRAQQLLAHRPRDRKALDVRSAAAQLIHENERALRSS